MKWWYSDSDDKNGDGYYMNKLGQYYRPSELKPEVYCEIDDRIE